MRWVVALVFLAVACAAVITANTTLTDTRDGGSEADSAENDSRQELYNGFLNQARSDVRNNPEQNCDPDYQDLVVDQVDATSANRALVKLAMGDACIEAGEYSDVAEYSSYHDSAP